MSTDIPLIGDYSTPSTPLSGARIGVVTFPGTLDDVDAARAVRLAGAEAVSLWHADADPKAALARVDAVVVPGGFSYGDYLRAGAISRFAPMMTAIAEAAGGPQGGADALPVWSVPRWPRGVRSRRRCCRTAGGSWRRTSPSARARGTWRAPP